MQTTRRDAGNGYLHQLRGHAGIERKMAMTPKQWDRLFDPESKNSYYTIKSSVMSAARGHLATVAPGIHLSTNELVEALYPRAVADQTLTGDLARAQLYKFIGRLAVDGLQDCCVKGEVTGKFMGRVKRPWLWFAPPDTELCYACGQPLPWAAE